MSIKNASLYNISNNKNYTFKIILLGDSGVGKTSILKKYIENKFTNEYQCTIGIDFSTKFLEISGKNVTLKIWDTFGTEKYLSIAKSYYSNTNACFLVFDLTSENSFNSMEKWFKIFCEYCDPNINNNFIVLGNKCDLFDKKVDEKKIDNFINEKNWKYFETSAKDGKNIEQCFRYISEVLIKQKDNEINYNNINNNINNIDNNNRNNIRNNSILINNEEKNNIITNTKKNKDKNKNNKCC
jgi:small GTP-binding protein